MTHDEQLHSISTLMCHPCNGYPSETTVHILKKLFRRYVPNLSFPWHLLNTLAYESSENILCIAARFDAWVQCILHVEWSMIHHSLLAILMHILRK